MTTCYFKVNPLATEVQKISLPIDSIVFIGMNNDAISSLFMPSLFLNQNYSTDYKQSWFNYYWTIDSQGVVTTETNFPLTQNCLTMARLTTGYVPFDSTFTAEVHGFTRSFGGEALNVSRQAYEKTDGSTFLLDRYTIALNTLYFDLWENDTYQTKTHIVDCYITRDSEGIILGGFSTGWGKNVTMKVGNRPRQVYCVHVQPETVFGNIPFTPNDIAASILANVSTSSFVPESEATKVGDAQTVSITDYFTYSSATPVTFPMHITADERSYSYIQF